MSKPALDDFGQSAEMMRKRGRRDDWNGNGGAVPSAPLFNLDEGHQPRVPSWAPQLDGGPDVGEPGPGGAEPEPPPAPAPQPPPAGAPAPPPPAPPPPRVA